MSEENGSFKDKVLTPVLNGLAIVAVGLGLTGWLNPALGLCLIVAGVLYWLYEMLTSKTVRARFSLKRRWLTGICVALVLGLVSLPPAIRKIRPGQSETVKTPENPSQKPQMHTLLVRMRMDNLPVRIAPTDVAYILQLNPNIERWALDIPNQSIKAITWPIDFRSANKGPRGDLIYACELTNNEEKTMLAVTVPFGVSFHQLEILPTAVTKNKDGTRSFSFPGPVADRVAVNLGHDLSKWAREGALVKEFTHSITLASVAPGSTVRVYLVNQSKFISKFTFPQKASAVIAGDASRVEVALIRPEVNVGDSLPSFGLPPATYHWNGIPDAP